MTRKRPDRTARRADERAARKLVRDRERLAGLERGGSAARPIEVGTAAVIEVRTGAMKCPQCGGSYDLGEHRAEHGLRVVAVTCRVCHVSRQIWWRIVPAGPN
ncbi:MAG: hypothetical protein H6709_17460 [Kofleriaceae bacterium]|nr:hypothetical protein [Myxococcales bacterium]MCB9564447.1 hypothetical protein [Kofleriaceae bacterium]MCB9573871.1 hypothetical protein [Kofleriaceae bacterium]